MQGLSCSIDVRRRLFAGERLAGLGWSRARCSSLLEASKKQRENIARLLQPTAKGEQKKTHFSAQMQPQ